MSNYNCQACSKPMVEWFEVCADCTSKLEEVAPSASANTGSPKLPHVDMDDVRLLESFMAHRAPAQTPTWETWSRVKAALVEVRQLRASA